VGSDAYGTGDIPFVRTSDLSNFEISTDPTKSVSDEVYREYSAQQKLRAGDILMVVDGRYRIGATAMLTEHNCRCVIQSHLRIISTMREERLDPYELLFALSLPSVKLRLRNLVFIQSTLGTLGTRLFELRIPVLHGDGPWAARVDKFRDMLQRRGIAGGAREYVRTGL
jgi:type I restriction enzyme M protein